MIKICIFISCERPFTFCLFFFPLIFLFLSHPRMNNRQSNNSHISRKSVPIAISPIVRYPKSCRDQNGNPYIIIIMWMKLCGMKWMNPSAYISASSSRWDVYTHTFIFLSFFWLSCNGTGWPWFAFDWNCVFFPAGRVRLSIVICFQSVRMVYTNDEQDDLAISPTTARGKL